MGLPTEHFAVPPDATPIHNYFLSAPQTRYTYAIAVALKYSIEDMVGSGASRITADGRLVNPPPLPMSDRARDEFELIKSIVMCVLFFRKREDLLSISRDMLNVLNKFMAEYEAQAES